MNNMTRNLARLAAAVAALALLPGCTPAAARPSQGCATAPGLRVCDAWVRFAPTGDTAAAYATITSTGPADTLTRVQSDLGGVAMLHTTVHNGPVDTMRTVGSLVVPAGGTLILAVDGDHVMVTNLTRTADPGATTRLTLTFRRAGTLTVDASVRGYPTDAASAGTS